MPILGLFEAYFGLFRADLAIFGDPAWILALFMGSRPEFWSILGDPGWILLLFGGPDLDFGPFW